MVSPVSNPIWCINRSDKKREYSSSSSPSGRKRHKEASSIKNKPPTCIPEPGSCLWRTEKRTFRRNLEPLLPARSITIGMRGRDPCDTYLTFGQFFRSVGDILAPNYLYASVCIMYVYNTYITYTTTHAMQHILLVLWWRSRQGWIRSLCGR